MPAETETLKNLSCSKTKERTYIIVKRGETCFIAIDVSGKT